MIIIGIVCLIMLPDCCHAGCETCCKPCYFGCCKEEYSISNYVYVFSNERYVLMLQMLKV